MQVDSTPSRQLEANETEAQRWFPRDLPPSARRQRKHGLAAELRQLIEDVLLLDADEVQEADLAQAEHLLRTARQFVGGLPDLRASGGVYGSAGDASLYERSPLSGRCNAMAAPLTVRFEGLLTFGAATYGQAFEGPPGCVHGGHVIAAFDDLLGVAQAASGSAGMTGTLSVRLRRPTPLHRQIDYEAGVTSHDGRKILAWGRSLLDGELLAEATALFITPRDGLRLPTPG